MGPGAASTTSSWPPWSTSTGSTTAGSTAPATTGRQPSSKLSTTVTSKPQSLRENASSQSPRNPARFNADGSTVSIAGSIIPTLKQFPNVQHVKIYDRAGQTSDPIGPTDSIPD